MPPPLPTALHHVQAFPPTIDPSVGDWLCTCGNWNWAKRHECNMCRGSKEAANVGAKRTGAAGGFIEYDQSEDQRRKMRAFEAAQQVQARKAEKKKCEYCKRCASACLDQPVASSLRPGSWLDASLPWHTGSRASVEAVRHGIAQLPAELWEDQVHADAFRKACLVRRQGVHGIQFW